MSEERVLYLFLRLSVVPTLACLTLCLCVCIVRLGDISVDRHKYSLSY